MAQDGRSPGRIHDSEGPNTCQTRGVERATFLSPTRGVRGDGVPTVHFPAAELRSNSEDQAARKPPVSMGDKKVAPPSRRQESRLSQ